VACLLGAILGGCETSKADPAAVARAEAVRDIDRTSARLESIGNAVRSVQQRRTIELAVPAASRGDPVPPSGEHDRLVSGADAEGRLFVQLLRSAASNAPLPTRLVSTECRADRGDPQDPALPVPQASKSIAKALDAVILIQVVPCPQSRGMQINSPAASQPTDTNWGAQRWEAEKKKREEADRPFLVPGADLRAVMVGQGYRFADKNDQEIFVPQYIAGRFQAATERVKGMLLPLSQSRDKVAVFFDRTRTLGGKDVMGSTLGWFAAYADPERNELYFSPTLVRAAFVLCGSRIPYSTLAPGRLAELRKQVETRYVTPNDAAGLVGRMTNVADEFDRCMDREVDFLLGHELAHAMLGIGGEARADCVGRAVAAARGHSSGGVFESLIFGLVESEDVSLLGPMTADNQRRLACRAKLHRETANSSETPLAVAVKACEKLADVCK
jgi:hypothetical protein